MPAIEVCRTLVKSPPELWSELEGDRLADALGEVTVWPTEQGRELAWEAAGAHGTATLEPAAWGTKVTLTAEVEQMVAEHGVWARLRRKREMPQERHLELERRLEELLEDLGTAHRKPFGAG